MLSCASPPLPRPLHTHPGCQASATPEVRDSIIRCLGLVQPVVLQSSFNRPNIAYSMRYKECIEGTEEADGSEESAVEVRVQGGFVLCTRHHSCEPLCYPAACLAAAMHAYCHRARRVPCLSQYLQDLIAFMRERQGQCGIIYARLRWGPRLPHMHAHLCTGQLAACPEPHMGSKKGTHERYCLPYDCRSTCDWLAGILGSNDLDAAAYHAGACRSSPALDLGCMCRGGTAALASC